MWTNISQDIIPDFRLSIMNCQTHPGKPTEIFIKLRAGQRQQHAGLFFVRYSLNSNLFSVL
jgi:hypothetical protein